uniref:MUC1 isoform T13 n=1 Tax=Homo sapiens TaxID=9606 RepID=A5YRV4_HUMAN|nr:MUC1 isoform T13 [Homo sapiens]
MTPGTQSPFFLLLLLTVLTATTAPKPATVVTGSGHASSTPGGEKETSATQRSSVPSSTEKNAGAGLCSGCAGHCLSHCLGCLSVPPKELRAAGHLSSPGYLPSYERVPHLPHPWALCAP